MVAVRIGVFAAALCLRRSDELDSGRVVKLDGPVIVMVGGEKCFCCLVVEGLLRRGPFVAVAATVRLSMDERRCEGKRVGFGPAPSHWRRRGGPWMVGWRRRRRPCFF